MFRGQNPQNANFEGGHRLAKRLNCWTISTAERNRINKFFRKANRRHLVTQIFDIDTLIETTDSRLFRSITYPDHCLNYLLPSKRNYTMQLRPKAHNFTLPHIHTTLLKTRLSIDVFLALYDYTFGCSLLSCTYPLCIVFELTLDIVFFIFTFVFIFLWLHVLQCDCHCFFIKGYLT